MNQVPAWLQITAVVITILTSIGMACAFISLIVRMNSPAVVL